MNDSFGMNKLICNYENNKTPLVLPPSSTSTSYVVEKMRSIPSKALSIPSSSTPMFVAARM